MGGGDMSKPIRFIVADDHHLVRQGVAAFLRTEPDLELVGEAADGHEAVELCRRHQPDVALMDLLMKGGGADGIREIQKVSPRTQIVVLTSYEDTDHAVKAIRAGALSYLLKDVAAEDLVVAVRRAASRLPTFHPRVAGLLADALRQPEDQAEALTAREQEILGLIAQALSNRQIAARLGIAEKTVKVHVSNVLAKLGLPDRTNAAVYAWRAGYVTSDGPADGPKRQ
jgi:NarL family two-component system response regulator LiaR